MGSISARLPYWQVNVPEGERTAECPEFLRNLTAKDIGIISMPDSEYRTSSWPEVRELVRNNRLDLFQRVPSQLRRYLAYTWQLRRDYGSIMDFILAVRLHWEAPVVPAGSRPFECDDDVRILRNDWPYGIDERIVHLVVWTKFDLEEDPVTTDLTDAARGEIEAYVQRKFGSKLPRDRVRRNVHIQKIVILACPGSSTLR